VILNITWLAPAYLEHLGTANGAGTLGGRTAVLHCNGLGILHFPLGTTLHTIPLHQSYLQINNWRLQDKLPTSVVSSAWAK
jgi:hypothetical protein